MFVVTVDVQLFLQLLSGYDDFISSISCEECETVFSFLSFFFYPEKFLNFRDILTQICQDNSGRKNKETVYGIDYVAREKACHMLLLNIFAVTNSWMFSSRWTF